MPQPYVGPHTDGYRACYWAAGSNLHAQRQLCCHSTDCTCIGSATLTAQARLIYHEGLLHEMQDGTETGHDGRVPTL